MTRSPSGAIAIGKIADGAVGRPLRRLSAGRTIDDRDGARIRQVDEDPAAITRELEAFRMRRKRNIWRPCAGLDGIDDRETAAAVADEDLLMLRIHPDIVGVAAECDLAGRCEAIGVEEPDGPVARIGNRDSVSPAAT